MNAFGNGLCPDEMALQRWENEGGCSTWPAMSPFCTTGVAAPTLTKSKPEQESGAANQPVTLTELDRFRLGRLLNCAETAAMTPRRFRLALEARLEEAQAIPVDAAPRTLVTMNSRVRLIDLDSGKQSICMLVYPDDRDLFPQSVGVLQPLGLRLLGRRVGESIQMSVNGQTKRFQIDSVLYQPEAAGALAQ